MCDLYYNHQFELLTSWLFKITLNRKSAIAPGISSTMGQGSCFHIQAWQVNSRKQLGQETKIWRKYDFSTV
jgi:hypothetical protein